MRTNFILVDYENVQHIDPAEIKEGYEVIVFVGAGQKSVKTETAILIDSLDDRGSFFPVVGNGKNAVDLHIAFRAGQLSVQYPKAQFHILSGDGDFIPLVTYLNTQKIPATNGKTVAQAESAKSAKPPTPPKLDAPGKKAAEPEPKTPRQLAELLVKALGKPKATKPSTLPKLYNHLQTIAKAVTHEQFKAVVQSLVARKFIEVNGDKVSYPKAK